MKRVAVSIFLLGASLLKAQDFLDRVEDALSFSAMQDQVRARLSGTFDLEGYHFEQPAPGLINSTSDNLFNPRLTLFLDGQIGSKVYLFVQTRFDRGFDPSNHGARAAFDEYALRFTPWKDGRFSIQIGKFATVAGNFVPRHLSWENPFINAPLPYENLTGLEDRSGRVVTNLEHALMIEKYEFIPIIWGPSYATGASVSGHIDKFDYAAEIKNTSLSSRPEVWDITQTDFRDPTFSGRIGYRPSQMWNFGLSASDGAYLQRQAESMLLPGRSIGDYREQVLGQDISFAWHHVQLWAEFYEACFDIPRAGEGDTFAWYLEAKYKFTPQLFGAVRWNQQWFGDIDGSRSIALGQDLLRLDAAVGYRFTPHLQMKLQYSFQKETSGAQNDNDLFAAQFTARF